MTYELRREQQYFVDLDTGKLSFLPEKAVNNYQIGDELVIKEFIPAKGIGRYEPGYSDNLTGREIRRKVTFVYDKSYYGLAPGYVIMQIEKL